MTSINWSKKVQNLDENIRREIGLEGENEAKHILIKVQNLRKQSNRLLLSVKMKHFWICLSSHRKDMGLHPPQS